MMADYLRSFLGVAACLALSAGGQRLWRREWRVARGGRAVAGGALDLVQPEAHPCHPHLDLGAADGRRRLAPA